MKITKMKAFTMLAKNPKLLHDDILDDFGHIDDTIRTVYLEDIQCFEVYDKSSDCSVTYPVEQYL